jgi:hypothetical protein
LTGSNVIIRYTYDLKTGTLSYRHYSELNVMTDISVYYSANRQ